MWYSRPVPKGDTMTQVNAAQRLLANFVVEYRTKGQNGRVYPTKHMDVGSHKATDITEAAQYAQKRLGPNVEIVDVKFTGSL